MYKGTHAWGNTVSAQIHTAVEQLLEDGPFKTESCRDIRTCSQLISLHWRPFKTGPTFCSFIRYDDGFIMTDMSDKKKGDIAWTIGMDLASRFPEMLTRISDNSDKWDALQTKIHNRVWRRAWRNTTALWRKFTMWEKAGNTTHD